MCREERSGMGQGGRTERGCVRCCSQPASWFGIFAAADACVLCASLFSQSGWPFKPHTRTHTHRFAPVDACQTLSLSFHSPCALKPPSSFLLTPRFHLPCSMCAAECMIYRLPSRCPSRTCSSLPRLCAAAADDVLAPRVGTLYVSPPPPPFLQQRFCVGCNVL